MSMPISETMTCALRFLIPGIDMINSTAVRGPATGLYGVVDGGAALALDDVSFGVGFLDDEQFFVKCINDGGSNQRGVKDA